METTTNDHDLLVRIDEQVKQMRISFETERLASATRASRLDDDLAAHKRETRKELDDQNDEINSLKTSRAQFYAVATALSFVASMIVKMFWPK